jgi:hypothetical protein
MEHLKIFLFLLMILYFFSKNKESFINYSISNESPEKNMTTDFFFKNMNESDIIKADYQKVYDMYDKINDFDFLFLEKKICLDGSYCISSPSPEPLSPP